MPLIQPNDWEPVGVAALEPAALGAVHTSSNLLLTASPGAGKTEMLAQRACYLLQTGQSPAPQKILAISYKRDAASNLRERVRERCGPGLAHRFDSFTFDAFAKGLLDRFRKSLPPHWAPTADYRIWQPRRYEVEDFVNRFQTEAVAHQHGFDRAITPMASRFILDNVTGQPLEREPSSPTDLCEFAANTWWTESLRGAGGTSRLMFPMIGRLVELLLRENPLITSALRACYSHVFLDEFQDTTLVQYELVYTAFGGASTTLTAVGDHKQRIMAWAGALDDAFPRFERDFAAKRGVLTLNWRSSPELVEIQHAIAAAIDSAYVPVESAASRETQTTACEIREYGSIDREAEDLAQLICSLLSDGLHPREIALLVRQRPQDYEKAIADALAASGVRMRVEAELQDLLAERLTRVVLPHLRLGATERSGEHWQQCLDIAEVLWNADPEEDSTLLTNSLASLHRSLRARMQVPAQTKEETRPVIDVILDHLGRDKVKQAYGEYQQGDHQAVIEEQLAAYLTESCQRGNSWLAALDDFEGIQCIPMMTIHKSKSLEFQVVIFVGLDDKGWWSFPQQPEEGRSAFFVAFSRAEQQVIFTYCESRGGRAGISSLYDLLSTAGVRSAYVG